MENAGYLEKFTAIWYILRPFSNVVVIWYLFPRFGILCQEKSGNPAAKAKSERSKIQMPSCTTFF
jgi:hypothetical protein